MLIDIFADPLNGMETAVLLNDTPSAVNVPPWHPAPHVVRGLVFAVCPTMPEEEAQLLPDHPHAQSRTKTVPSSVDSAGRALAVASDDCIASVRRNA